MRDLASELRAAADEQPEIFGLIYRALRWDQKAQLLKAIIAEGDHPPGFRVSFDISVLSAAERDYLMAIGIAPRKDPEGEQ